MLSFIQKIWPFSAFAARETRMMEQVKAVLAQQDATWRGMSAEELLGLPDEELYQAAQSRVTAGMEACTDTAARLSIPNEVGRVFYVACCYETIICAKGSRDFFAGEGEVLLPFLSDALHRIGAWEHRTLLDELVKACEESNGGVVGVARESAKKPQKGDTFAQFDRKFAQTESVREALIAYVRANVSDF